MPRQYGLPPAEEMAFLLLDSVRQSAVSVDALPQKEWELLCGQMIQSVGMEIAEWYAQQGADEKEP